MKGFLKRLGVRALLAVLEYLLKEAGKIAPKEQQPELHVARHSVARARARAR